MKPILNNFKFVPAPPQTDCKMTPRDLLMAALDLTDDPDQCAATLLSALITAGFVFPALLECARARKQAQFGGPR